MSRRSMVAVTLIAFGVSVSAIPASARPAHRHGRVLNVTRSRGLLLPVDPLVEATPNFTERNGKTTDVNVFADGSVGDGFYGFQTPGLASYGFAGGGLTPYQLQ